MIWITLGIYAALSILAILLYIPKLAQYRYAFKKPPYKRAKVKRKISVVVPARGESKVIGDLFASIAKQDYDKAFFDVNVIVKDPDDPTVALAEKMGARVFVVQEQSCKGDALDGYFKAIGEGLSQYDAFVIVDADAVLDPHYVSELNNALEHNYDIYLTRKFVKNYLGGKSARTVFTNCSALTWPILDDLGNKYRMLNDMPLNMCGQGMMVRRSVIERLGGWPYRTLTEDYELKLDSLLKGFRSMFYPYAIIYTEEALHHKDNFLRRVRWLTGYSQCDKKYKQQIRDQIKKRGAYTSGEWEYFFGIVPLIIFLVVSVATVLAGTGITVYYVLTENPLWFLATMYLIVLPFGVMYVLLLGYSVLAMLACPEMFAPLGFWEKCGTALFNPFYLLEYVPIYIISKRYVRKNTDAGWEQTARVEYDFPPEYQDPDDQDPGDRKPE